MVNTLLGHTLVKLIELLLLLHKYTGNRKVLVHLINCLSAIASFCVFLGEYGMALELYIVYIKFTLVLFDVIH